VRSLCWRTASFLAVSFETFTVVDFMLGIEYSGIFKHPSRATTRVKLFRESEPKVTPYHDARCLGHDCLNPTPRTFF